MKNLINVFIAALLLSGCGGSNQDPARPTGTAKTPVYGIEYKTEVDYGLSTNLLDHWYEKTAACMGMSEADTRLVVVITNDIPQGIYSAYWPGSAMIYLPPGEALDDISTVKYYRHELVHHFLTVNGLGPDGGHSGIFWTRNQGTDCELWNNNSIL